MSRRALQEIPGDLEMDAERCRRSLRAFIADAWPVLEPATPLVPGFHIDAITDHLEAITAGHREFRAQIPWRTSGSMCREFPMPRPYETLYDTPGQLPRR